MFKRRAKETPETVATHVGVMDREAKKMSVRGRRMLILAFAVTVVVGMIAGTLIGLWRSGYFGDQEIARDELSPQISKAQDLVEEGDYAAADKYLASQIAQTADQDELFDLYLQKGVTLENAEQYGDALVAYQNAERIKKNFTIYDALGRVSEARDDKQAAVGYYEQAIQHVDPDSPTEATDKQLLEQKIKELRQ